MKDVQCHELFGGIALKNHAFSFFSFSNIRHIICIVSVDSAMKCVPSGDIIVMGVQYHELFAGSST